MRSKCGSCGVEGTIHGVPEGVVPEQLVCGNCGNISNYQASRYELIGQEYEGDLTTPFYLSPDYRTASRLRCPHCKKPHHNGKPINGEDSYRCLGCGKTWNSSENPYDRRTEWLKKAHTRQLLTMLNSLRAYGDAFSDDAHRLTIEELKAELALREHIPNKKEGHELRRKRAQGKAV